MRATRKKSLVVNLAVFFLKHIALSFVRPYSTSVWKRNERERYRVRCVNNGYETLRKHLPVSDVEKRISKVDTLRLAIRYIKHLEAVLKNEEHIFKCNCFEGFAEESEGHVQIDVNVRNVEQRFIENQLKYS
ncbi:Helix-loop-helix DNA-binding domain protein [Ostertagia ostertagi]